MIKKMSKKVFSLFLTFATVLSLMPALTLSAKAAPPSNGTYDVSSTFTTPVGSPTPGAIGTGYSQWNSAWSSLTYDGGTIGGSPSSGITMLDPTQGCFIDILSGSTTYYDSNTHWLEVTADNVNVSSFILAGLTLQTLNNEDAYSVTVTGTKSSGGTVSNNFFFKPGNSNNTSVSTSLTAFSGIQITSFRISYIAGRGTSLIDFVASGTSADPTVSSFTFIDFSILNATPPSTLPTATAPSTGDGTSGNPYQITTLANLYWIADQVNNQSNTFTDKYFIQTAEIDASATSTWFSGEGWLPIGSTAAPFAGNYNGGNFKIKSLKINTTASSASNTVLGLFGVVGDGAALSNVKLENVDIDVASGSSSTFESFIGGLAGVNYGTISNCSVTGTLDAASQQMEIGGLVGDNGGVGPYNSGVITGCTSNCTINTGINYQTLHVGGLVGASFTAGSSITNCSSTGTVTGIGLSAVNQTSISSGGLIGYASDTTITGCSSDCTVSATNVRSQANAGGLIGSIVGTCSISGCSSIGSATASDSSGSQGTRICSGGLIGYSFSGSTITNCHSSGNAAAAGTGSSTSIDTYANVHSGGFLGYVNLGGSAIDVSQCYSTGSASSTVNTYGQAFSGGFGGYYITANISKCYSTGDASAVATEGYASAGGFTGYIYGANASTSPSTLTNCYSTGNASADCITKERSGGLSGVIHNSTATNCYSTGVPSTVKNSVSASGGLTGINNAGTVSNCYYDTTSSGKTDSDRGTPMSTSDMKKASFVTALVDANWKSVANLNSGYPILNGIGDGALPCCTITYMSDSSTTYTTNVNAQGKIFAAAADPAAAGSYVFSGWFTGSDGSGTEYKSNLTIVPSAPTLTLYAKWEYTNTAPTVTTINTLTGATEDTAYTISYADLAAAADEADTDVGDTLSFRVESVTTGTLTKGGAAVTAGTTTLGAGESLFWTPAANANGDLNAFTVKAYDGTAVSATAVQVVVATSAVNDAPTGKPTISGTASVGSELTSSTTAIADLEGLGTFSYQWQVSANGTDSWSNIAANSTNDKYTVTSDEAGKYVRVAVSYTDGGSTAETVYSDAFGPNKTSQAALVYNNVTKTYGDAAFTPTYSGGSGTGAVSYTSSDTSVATIDAATGEVTIKKSGSTTLTLTKAGDGTYTSASDDCTLTVDKAVLTATVGDYTKHYGDANPSFTVDMSGFVNGDTAGTAAGYAAPTASCAADTTTDAGTATITISGGAATNYTFDITDTGTLTINPKTLTYTVTSDNREYNGTTGSTGTVNLVGVINSDVVTASGTFAFESAGVANGKTVNVTGIALSGTDKNNYTLSATSTSTTANITAKSVSIASVTISDKVYDGATGATILAAGLSGKIGTEDVSADYSAATATFANASVGNGKTVNVTGLALSGADKNNYVLSSGSFTASGNIINDGTVLAPTANMASGEMPPGTSVTLSSGTVGAEIRYTIDGSTPSASSTLYTGAFTISDPVTIKAIAVKTGMNDSSVLTLDYTMADTVTAHNSTELGTYISSTYVSIINLVSGTTYTYDGSTITRTLTINGNGATINVGTGIDGTIVKMTSGAVPNVTGKVFFEVGIGGNLTMNSVKLYDASTRILSVYNVKTGGVLSLDGVVFDGFYANLSTDAYPGASNIPGSYNNFGVHAEPGASSTTVNNCTFGLSNSFRNAIAIRGGTAVISNNTFVGTATHDRQNQTDGNEYAVYLYGGTSTVTGNDMSGYDGRLKLNYITSAISTAPYYDITATIIGNNIHDNMCGINLVGSWHALSSPAVATINGTALTSSANAYTLGQALAAQNTLSNNAQGGVLLGLDQNDYYVDTRNTKEYGTSAYCSDFLSLASKTSSSATLSFSSCDSALSLIANQKAGSFVIEVSEDNGATWSVATTSALLGTSSTGATVTLTSGKTYLLRAALTITSNTRPIGSVADVPADIVCYSNTVSAAIAASSGDGGTTTTSTVVEVDGKKQDAGTSATSTNSSGQSVTTVKVDDTKLDKILEASGAKPTVTLPSTGSDVTVGELNGQTVKNMENKEATLEIKTDTVTYTLPASQINIDAVSEQLGSQVALKDIKVSVKIAEPSADTVKIVEDTANKGNYQLVVKPVEFEITCTSGDKTVEVSKFNGYVERTVAIPDGVDPSKITTGIVLNADGTFSHVPTQIVVINGKYYAKINSLTNSTYSVIWNPVTFTDVSSHWAKNAVNDMGSRMVVTGMGNGTYEPDRSITRAEFAAIVVRAMGLQKGTTESAFGDVMLTDWFNGYVDTATSYALITGYDSTSYGPNDTITREQAMAILARAMKLTGLSVSLTGSEVSSLLASYKDSSAVSDYAKTSVASCIKAGLVTGTSATTISPKAYVTRAEVAVMVQRLLQKSGLI